MSKRIQQQQIGNLIYYNDIIHEIKEVCYPCYRISALESVEYNITFKVNQQDQSIQTIYADAQTQIRKANAFKYRYNKFR